MRPTHSLGSLLLLAGAFPAAAQSIWYVDASVPGPGSGTRTDPYATIQHALSQPSTVDGDTVLVLPGTYPELVDFLGKDLVLASTGGAGVTTIDASAQLSLEQTTVKARGGESCTIAGFTIRGGAGTEIAEPLFGGTFYAGGGLLVIGSRATIRDCVLAENFGANTGGGIYVQDAVVALERCTIEGNLTSLWGGGAYLHESEVTMHEVTVRGNVAWHDGGGIRMVGGSLLLSEVLLEDNEAMLGGNGGNLACDRGASLTMGDSVVREGFTLDGDGGGLWADASTVAVVRCLFEANGAGDFASNREGGAIRLSGGSLSVDGTRFAGNAAGRGGAVLLRRATATIRSCEFTGNQIRSGLNYLGADGGALMAIHSAASVSGCVFRGNVAASASPQVNGPFARGGAAWCDTPGLEIRSCLFQENHAFYDGAPDTLLTKHEAGALGGALFGPARVSDSSFLRNRATSERTALQGRAEGGAIYGASRVVRSSFVGNQVDGVGPVPDVGPAAEAAALACCTFDDNLPPTLPPLGPNCVVHPCELDAVTAAPAATLSRVRPSALRGERAGDR